MIDNIRQDIAFSSVSSQPHIILPNELYPELVSIAFHGNVIGENVTGFADVQIYISLLDYLNELS